MQAGVGENGVALRKLMNRGGAELVGLCHGAGRVVCNEQIAAGEVGLAGLAARLRHSRRNAVLHFGRGIIGEGMAEVLHDIQPVSAADHAQPDHVISRVEQVRAMRRGQHEMFMSMRGVEVERDVLAFLIELHMGRGRQALGQGGLAVKLMRKLPRRKHRFGVRAGRLAQSAIERQTRRAGLRSGLIRQVQQLVVRRLES